jgi:hypothetical protein
MADQMYARLFTGPSRALTAFTGRKRSAFAVLGTRLAGVEPISALRFGEVGGTEIAASAVECLTARGAALSSRFARIRFVVAHDWVAEALVALADFNVMNTRAVALAGRPDPATFGTGACIAK